MAGSPSALTGTHRALTGTRALTERDVVLLRCLATGGSTGQIAFALSVSGNTVRTRIRRVQGKLGVSTRGQLVHAARALDLL